MVQVDLYTLKGEKKGKLSLPDKIFKVKDNPVLIAQSIRVYLSNQRQSPAKTLRRGEIRATGKKVYRQKGTGGARHGDKKAPIFVKGGKAHGPTGEQYFKLKMAKKMKRLALFSSLSNKVREGKVMGLESLKKIEPKTTKMAEIITNLKLEPDKKKVKVTLVLGKPMVNVLQAGRNLKGLSLKQANLLNPYEVLKAKYLVFEKDSLLKLKDTYGIK